jgi:DNA polymerase-3 subunit beta
MIAATSRTKEIMKVTFDVPELQKRLSALAAVVGRKAQEPVYRNVRIFTDEGFVKLTAIDIDNTLTVKLPGAKADGPINFLTEYDKFSKIVQPFTLKEAAISYENEQVATLTSGKKKYTLKGNPTAQFMELPVVVAIADRPAIGGFTLGLPGLKEQIEQVLFAVPPPDGKFVVPSALLESTADTLRLVTTDGVRLVIASIPANLGEFSFTVPKPALELVQKLDGGSSVTIVETEGVFFFSTELEVLTYSKTHSEFPAYGRVIPAPGSYPTAITLNEKDPIVRALASMNPVCDDEKPAVRFSVDENGKVLTLQAVHAESTTKEDVFTNTGFDELDANTVGAASVMKLDIKMLAPFLERATFPITIMAKSESSIVDIHANGGTQDKPTYRFLIMPMRA